MPLAATATSLLFLAGYIMLAGGAFTLIKPGLGLLIVPVPLLAIPLHMLSRHWGDVVGMEHSRWQMRTFGLFLLLFLVLVTIFFILGASFTDGPALDRLEAIGNAYNSGKVDLYASLAGLWEIKELQGYTLGASVWTALALLWPLKRAIQGMIALLVGAAPKALRHWWQWLALLTAIAAQGGALAVLLARQG
ncbi:hypothetical protein [Desulfovibrio sp.]|uniref:hypothetical protein n=1 Tax=Desulfovibrio sp. TaxID=885 RepID=UPI0035B2FF47